MRQLLKNTLFAGLMLAPYVHSIDVSDIQTSKIDGMVSLPITGLKAVQSEGEIILISDNGRFAIKGQIYDLWYKKTLDTLTEMQDVGQRIDLKAMGLDVDTLNTVSLGQGKTEVVIFTDPRCAFCHALIQDAKALTKEYTFKLIAIPALGDKSNELAKAMSCAKDEGEALEALMNRTLNSLPVKSPCDSQRYDATLLTAQLMGIKGVPFMIAPDGSIGRGKPEDLKAWLEVRS